MTEAAESYAGWLASLDEAALTRLLERRPDATLAPRPRDLGELAERLEHPASLVRAVGQLRLPDLQTLLAVLTLGGIARLDALSALLDHSASDEPGHRRRVDESLRRLADFGLCWQVTGADGAVLVVGQTVLLGLVGDDVPLHPPIRLLLPAITVDGLRRILQAHGVRAVGPKAALMSAVADLLGDVAAVDRLLDTAPSDCRAELARLATLSPDALPEFGPEAYRRRKAALDWGSPRGLVFAQGYGGYDLIFPAEVALALRGRDYRMPFHTVPPPLPLLEVDPGRVRSETAAAAAGFLDLATDLFDRLDRRRVPALASGGLGARELAKLAKAAGADERAVRLALELAAAIGLLEVARVGGASASTVGTTDRFASWRAAEPPQRYAELLWAWWLSGTHLSRTRDADGKARPLLREEPGCVACRAARTEALAVLHRLAAGEGGRPATLPADLAERLLWERPGVHASDDREEPLQPVFEEARLLASYTRSCQAARRGGGVHETRATRRHRRRSTRAGRR